jgi:hypothetical protein
MFDCCLEAVNIETLQQKRPERHQQARQRSNLRIRSIDQAWIPAFAGMTFRWVVAACRGWFDALRREPSSQRTLGSILIYAIAVPSLTFLLGRDG